MVLKIRRYRTSRQDSESTVDNTLLNVLVEIGVHWKTEDLVRDHFRVRQRHWTKRSLLKRLLLVQRLWVVYRCGNAALLQAFAIPVAILTEDGKLRPHGAVTVRDRLNRSYSPQTVRVAFGHHLPFFYFVFEYLDLLEKHCCLDGIATAVDTDALAVVFVTPGAVQPDRSSGFAGKNDVVAMGAFDPARRPEADDPMDCAASWMTNSPCSRATSWIEE